MLANLGKFFTNASPLKASFASGVAHAVGLGLLGAWSLSDVTSSLDAPGGQVVIELQLQLSQYEPSPELLVPLPVQDYHVLVMPERSRIDTHWVRQVSTDVTLPEQEPQDDPEPVELDRLADEPARAPLGAPPPATQVASVDELPMREPAVRPPADMTRPEVERHEDQHSQQATRAVEQPADTTSYGNAPPQFTYQPSPTYPREAQLQRWQGTVMLRLEITIEGTVASVEVVRSSGHTVLDGVAVTTVRTWRCAPRRRGGQPVASTETLPIHFRLR